MIVMYVIFVLVFFLGLVSWSYYIGLGIVRLEREQRKDWLKTMAILLYLNLNYEEMEKTEAHVLQNQIETKINQLLNQSQHDAKKQLRYRSFTNQINKAFDLLDENEDFDLPDENGDEL